MFIPIASRRKVRICAIGCGAAATAAAVFAAVRALKKKKV